MDTAARCDLRRARPTWKVGLLDGRVRRMGVGTEKFGWPDRVRGTGRVAKRQEAASSGFNRPEKHHLTARAHYLGSGVDGHHCPDTSLCWRYNLGLRDIKTNREPVQEK